MALGSLFFQCGFQCELGRSHIAEGRSVVGGASTPSHSRQRVAISRSIVNVRKFRHCIDFVSFCSYFADMGGDHD